MLLKNYNLGPARCQAWKKEVESNFTNWN